MPLSIVFFFIHKETMSVNSRNILALARSVLAWVERGLYIVTPFVIRSVAVNMVLAGRRNHLVTVHGSRWSLRTNPMYDNQWALRSSPLYDNQWTLRTYPNPNSHRKVNDSYRGHQNEFYCPLIDWMLYWESPREYFVCCKERQNIPICLYLTNLCQIHLTDHFCYLTEPRFSGLPQTTPPSSIRNRDGVNQGI